MAQTTPSSFARQNPVRTGLFAVAGVVALGIFAGFALGYDLPEKAWAQIVTVTPVTVIAPPPPVPVPVVPIVPVIVPTTPVIPPTTVAEVVVVPETPPSTDTDPYGPPCCTETTPPVEPPAPPAPPTDPYGPPCCTEPTTPTVVVTPPTPPVTPPVIPPVTPPTEPPPPPPPAYCPNRPDLQIDNLPEGYYVDANGNCVTRTVTEVRQCVFLTGTPAVIQAGDAVNLSWETEGVSSISISNVTGPLPVDGSTTVYPTQNTTYVLTAPGVSNFTPCQTTVRITTIEQGPQCVSLKADKREIESGESVVLSWVTNNASSISINNGINTVTPTAAGSITVNPTSDTTYIATVPGAPSNVNCQVEVVIESTTCTSNCGGGGGGGGGRRSPRVVIDSVVEPLDEPLAFVYLSEVPYTGLELGTWGTVFYWIMLIGWSLALAYLVLFNAVPFVLARAKSFGGNVKEALNGDTGSSHGHDTHVAASVAHTSHGHGHDTHAEEAPAKPQGYSAHEGFRSFAAGEGLTIDDIVKGLSREIEQKHQAAAPVAAPTHEEVMQAVHTEFEAPTPSPEYVPAPTASASFKAAPAVAPMNDSVRDFIAALLNGDRETVFGMVRAMARQGEDTEAFVSHAACALDDAYRACIDGTTCHPDIAELTNGCHPSFLERLVHSLSGAVDGSYSSGMTGVKMALTRALNVVAG